MKVVVQRTRQAQVSVAGQVVGAISHGLVLLVGFTHADTMQDVTWMVDKVINLRIFDDVAGKMNHSLLEVGGAILSISQFTLYGDARKGRRPSFVEAARPEQAQALYDSFNRLLQEQGIAVATGQFGAEMQVGLTNDGPITLILDSSSLATKNT